MKQFNLVVCGGTFDHFHKGHESFLKYIFSVGQKVIVGVTSDKFVRRWKIDGRSWKQIESFEERKKAVLDFINKEEALDRVEILEINDLFGPTLEKGFPIDAIVISENTKRGAEIINRKRKELGLKELKILIASQVLAEDGKLISSARIRNGEINRVGRLYVKPLWLKKNLVLPISLRKEVKKPFGELLKEASRSFKNKNNLVITVGDITGKIFNGMSLGQNISVIDFKVAREKKFSNILELGFTGQENIVKVNNPAGYITSDLFIKLADVLKSYMEDKAILQVDGEEDLAVLPLVLLSPLNTIIYYGQPNKGIVRIRVSESVKEAAYRLVERFRIQK